MKPVNICLAVINCPCNNFEENLNTCVDIIKDAGRKKADMVVFPEMNLTGYGTGGQVKSIARVIDTDLIRSFSQLSDHLNIAVLTGLVEQAENGQIFVSHLVFVPRRPHGIYRKLHTAPNEQGIFTPGTDIPVFEHAGVRFGIQLCYDAHFPELSTAMALQRADLILLPHASPRGTSKQKFDSWMRHLPARAFDNGMFIAAVNQTGDNGAGLQFPGLTVVIGPDGNLISRSMLQKNHLHFVTLDPEPLLRVRSHRMRYFLPFRRNDLFPVSF
jgi:predicted amidohydrolase